MSLDETGHSAVVQVGNLLSVSDLNVVYRQRRGRVVRAVQNVSFSVKKNSIFALIGESGSGKTSIARAICGLETSTGTIEYHGTVLDQRGRGETGMRPVQMVHQNPASALNPRWPIWRSVAEPIVALKRQLKRSGNPRAEAARYLERVGLTDILHDRLPHQISGGQAQRAAIARAIATESKLIVLDEPVSALDAAVKKDVIALLSDLAEDEGVSYLVVTHDMSILGSFATDVAVMHAGHLVETGSSAEVLTSPREAYTRDLISAVPTLNRSGTARSPSP